MNTTHQLRGGLFTIDHQSDETFLVLDLASEILKAIQEQTDPTRSNTFVTVARETASITCEFVIHAENQ